MKNTKQEEWVEAFNRLLNERESGMYGYYKSIFKHDFEGGYPIEYDKPLINLFHEAITTTKREALKNQPSPSEIRELLEETKQDERKRCDKELNIIHECLTDLYDHHDNSVGDRVKECLKAIERSDDEIR